MFFPYQSPGFPATTLLCITVASWFDTITNLIFWIKPHAGRSPPSLVSDPPNPLNSLFFVRFSSPPSEILTTPNFQIFSLLEFPDLAPPINVATTPSSFRSTSHCYTIINTEQSLGEEAGACANMALERVPADSCAQGGVAKMSDPSLIKEIKQVVTIPVMAKARIRHFVEAQIFEAIGVDYIDESEVLTFAD